MRRQYPAGLQGGAFAALRAIKPREHDAARQSFRKTDSRYKSPSIVREAPMRLLITLIVLTLSLVFTSTMSFAEVAIFATGASPSG